MVRIRSTLHVVSRLTLAYAIALQALFGALAGPAFAGAVDTALILCRSGDEGTSRAPGGDGHMPADHCAVMCKIGCKPLTPLVPARMAPSLEPADGRSETLTLARVETLDGTRDYAPNARGPPRLS